LKRKFKQWRSSILSISTKQTITFHLNLSATTEQKKWVIMKFYILRVSILHLILRFSNYLLESFWSCANFFFHFIIKTNINYMQQKLISVFNLFSRAREQTFVVVCPRTWISNVICRGLFFSSMR
jgi:hypothetical protein